MPDQDPAYGWKDTSQQVTFPDIAKAKGVKMGRMRKNPIVAGYLEKVSAGLLEKFRQAITEEIKGKQGVYALYRNKNLYYVGLASNLKRRLNHHLKDRHQGKWTHFSLYIIYKNEHIKELESLLLRIAYPKGNAVKGNLKNANNLEPVMKKHVKDKQKQEFDELFAGKKPKTVKKKVSTKKKNTGTKIPHRPLLELIQKKRLRKWQRLYAKYKGKDYKALVRPNGEIERLDTRERFNSPSGAGKSIVNRTTNGYAFWKFKNSKGELVKLKEAL